MILAKRQKTIVDFLTKQGSASVAELCEMFSVSEMTIRRDLAELEKQGILHRTYGGATISETAFFELSFKAKVSQFVEEKQRIGQAAAEMVKDGDIVLLDSGSTTAQIARHLRGKRITVVTNALNIASELLDCQRIEILMCGGMLRKGPLCLVGPQVDDFFKSVWCDKLFLAVEGADVKGGLTVPDMIEARTKKVMTTSASEIIVVADHSKLGRNALGAIIPLAEANSLVTGNEAPREIVEQLAQHIEIIKV